MDTVLGFGIVNKLELALNDLGILYKGPLIIVLSIHSCFELWMAPYEVGWLFLANLSLDAFVASKEDIGGYILNARKGRRISS